MKAIGIDNAEHYVWGEGCDGWHLLKAPELSVIQERVPPHAGEALHYHQRAEQFFYILQGRAQIVIGDGAIALNAGQGIHIAANVPHRFENPFENAVDFLVISSPPSQGDRIDLEIGSVAI